MDRILYWDRQIFEFLNRLGQTDFDSFWLFVTNQRNWILLYLIVLLAYFYYLGWRKTLFSILILAAFLGICDQSTNFIKDFFHRLRPSQEPALREHIRALIHPHNYSFISGHASNSTLFVWFSIYLLRNKTRWIYLLIIWWLAFMFSRIYVGVHYPLDITGGIIWGLFLWWLSLFVYKRSVRKFQL